MNTTARHHHGDTREDGFRFDCTSNGVEKWLSPEAWERARNARRQWKIDHLDELVAKNRVYRSKAKRKQVLEMASYWFGASKVGKTAEIKRHLERGRDVGDVAIRMMVPVSVVIAVRDAMRKELTA